MDDVYQFFMNLMFDGTNHKSYGSKLTAVTEVCNHAFYIIDDINFFN